MVRCPRCRTSFPDPAPAVCPRCRAPLRLSDEPPPLPLDASFAIDRRAGRLPELDEPLAELGPAALVQAAAATAAPAAEISRSALGRPEPSGWELGARGARAAAPAGAETPPALAVPEPVVDALEIHLVRPPTWRRVLAGIVDAGPFGLGGVLLARALVGAASAALPAPATGLDGFLDLVARERVIVLSVAAAVTLALGTYVTLAHALAGATVGKRLLRLRVVGPDGARPTLARSGARTALAGLSVGLLGLGLALALFTRSGRALHDLVARTWVVEAPP